MDERTGDGWAVDPIADGGAFQPEDIYGWHPGGRVSLDGRAGLTGSGSARRTTWRSTKWRNRWLSITPIQM